MKLRFEKWSVLTPDLSPWFLKHSTLITVREWIHNLRKNRAATLCSWKGFLNELDVKKEVTFSGSRHMGAQALCSGWCLPSRTLPAVVALFCFVSSLFVLYNSLLPVNLLKPALNTAASSTSFIACSPPPWCSAFTPQHLPLLTGCKI